MRQAYNHWQDQPGRQYHNYGMPSFIFMKSRRRSRWGGPDLLPPHFLHQVTGERDTQHSAYRSSRPLVTITVPPPRFERTGYSTLCISQLSSHGDYSSPPGFKRSGCTAQHRCGYHGSRRPRKRRLILGQQFILKSTEQHTGSLISRTLVPQPQSMVGMTTW